MQPCTREAFLGAKMRHLELQFLLCSSGAALASAQLVLNATRASMHGFERGLFVRSLGLEAVRSACEDRASIACWSSEKCPFALHTSAFCSCAERYSFVRHGGVHVRFWTRSFLHGSFFSEYPRSTCKDRASIACQIPERRPFACCVPKRFLLLL